MAQNRNQPKLDAAVAQDKVTEEAGEPVSGGVKADLDLLKYIMGGVIIVLLVGFATMFIAVFGIFRDAEAEKTATYQSMKDEVNDQNAKIDALTKAIENQPKPATQ